MSEQHVIAPIAGRISFDDVEKDLEDRTPTAAPTIVEASEKAQVSLVWVAGGSQYRLRVYPCERLMILCLQKVDINRFGPQA